MRKKSGVIWKGAVMAGSVLACAVSIVGVQPFFLHAVQQVHVGPVAPPSWQQTYDQGQALYSSGKYDQAYKLWGSALKEAEAQGAADHGDGVEQIEVLKHLALMYKTQAQQEKAAHMYEKAIVIATKRFGATSAPVAQLFLELGRIYTYSDAKNYAKANEALLESYRINQALYGRDTIPTGDVAMALGALRQAEHKYAEAAAYHELVVKIGNLLEPNTISCCRIGPRQQLASCYIEMGRYKDALAVDKELMDMVRKGAPSMVSTVQAQMDTVLFKMQAK